MQENFFEALNDLTEKGAQQAQATEAQNIECVNPHKRAIALTIEVESYPRLIDAITSLETGFFRSSIPEGKKKGTIYECSKFIKIKYTLPSLNEAATPAVRKNNAALYRIQMALANMTSPIDDYVHKKLKDPATKIKSNDDLEFAHLMQKLLSDVASNITQAKIKSLHKSIELPGKHIKRLQQRTGAERIVPFVRASRMCMTQHPQRRIPLNTPFKPIIVANFSNTPRKQELSVNSQKFSRRKKTLIVPRSWTRLTGRKWQREQLDRSRVQNQDLQSIIYHTKEDRRLLNSPRLLETQKLCRGEIFQNRIPDINMQNNKDKILHNLSRPRRRHYAHSDTPEAQEIFFLQWN
ncbi:hypothetical protein BB561_006605 [Smittium simulii]|uniref:Uncharacterized protein n=1 Tax=Smittium simulii TaxID=133385 RepID=A0A2T9Y2X7_9FUNG|nr:hypothetical protein BB561_006605 [Smittium simulii]